MDSSDDNEPKIAQPIDLTPKFKQSMQRQVSPDPTDIDHTDKLTPSKADKLGLSFKNRIYCTLWQLAGTDEIELKTIKVKPHQDTFKWKGREYNVILTHIQWRKAAMGNRRLQLNYKVGEANPISYRLPTVYSDAMLAQEIHRRKSYRSLLNKVETIVMVMIIAALIVAVAAIALYAYGNVTNRQESLKLTAENNALKQDNALLKAKIESLEAR